MSSQFEGINILLLYAESALLSVTRPEDLEVVTLNTAFPDLLQRHIANSRKEDWKGGASNEGSSAPGIGKFHTSEEIPAGAHCCRTWRIPAIVARHLLLLLLRSRLHCYIP